MVNATFNEALETLNYFLSELGEPHLSEKDAKDWIKGGETNKELQIMANDMASDSQTERASARFERHYEDRD